MGRGTCGIRTCYNPRAKPYAEGLCEVHRPRRQLSAKQERLISALARGESPTYAAMRIYGMSDPKKAANKARSEMNGPGFKDGVEACLRAKGVDPADGVVRAWEKMVALLDAQRTFFADGEERTVDDCQTQLKAAEMLNRVGPGMAPARAETKHQRQTAVVRIPAKDPPLEIEAVMEVEPEKDDVPGDDDV